MGKQKQQVISDWKAYRARFQERAEEIVSGLSLERKISLMSGRLTQKEIRSQILNKQQTHYNEIPYRAGGLEEEGVPPVLFVDGSRGVVCGRGIYTAFPVEAMRGASFDPELEERVGAAIAEEVIMAGGSLFGGVSVNLPYHPGWGRAQESYGEDSFLIGVMGSAMVKGVQSRGVIACVKHFAFNSMENNRLTVNITCDRRTEREVFLSHFKKCVEAGAGAVMTAYNSYQGERCGHHSYLIGDVLRGEWGFDGFTLCDFTWGISDTAKAAKAGMDLEMPHTHCYGENLLRAVEDGRVPESAIDASAVRIVRTLLAHDKVLNKNRGKLFSKKEHSELALRCAREGITLLQNKDGILPLKCAGPKKRIVVLGKLAEEANLGDKGSSQTYPPYVVTGVEGIRRQLEGAELVVYTEGDPSHCRRLARDADAVIIFVGNSYRDEGEHIKADESVVQANTDGGDRTAGIGLHPEQVRMAEAVYSVRRDAVLVITGGNAFTLENVREKAGAILMQFYPGMEGGTALGEVLFGKVNPSGHLPFSIPLEDGDLPEINWDAEQQAYTRYHGYTLLDKLGKKAAFPFGFGLSYTEFEFSEPKCEVLEEKLIVSVNVRNTGKRAGCALALMFVSPPGLRVERERRLLKAFQRVPLKKGEERPVTLSCALSELMYYDEEQECFKLEEGNYLVSVNDHGTGIWIDSLPELPQTGAAVSRNFCI